MPNDERQIGQRKKENVAFRKNGLQQYLCEEKGKTAKMQSYSPPELSDLRLLEFDEKKKIWRAYIILGTLLKLIDPL